ncbi:MAG: hypothetical protein ABL878_16835 [Burkholderiales bacterium]
MRWINLLLLPAALATSIGDAKADSVVVMSGEANLVVADQASSSHSTIEVEQIGIVNAVTVYQQGLNNNASFRSVGDSQNHIADQRGGSNLLAVESTGPDNASDIVQIAASGGQNAMLLLQNGANNQAIMEQDATGAGLSSITLTQSGNDNSAHLVQTGTDNMIALAQNGDANSATITQSGSGHSINLVQGGGGQVVIAQSNSGG